MPRYMVALLVAVGAAMSAIVQLVHGDLTLIMIIGASAATGLVTYQTLPSKKTDFNQPSSLQEKARVCSQLRRSSSRTGPVKGGRSSSRSDAAGALDRFRETSIVDRRVRGDVPPHPLPSGERLSLIFPCCA